jgi:HK97 family phage portal protein
VYGCVSLISEVIAGIPMKIYKMVENKKGEMEKQEDTKHPANELFKKPNYRDSLYEIKEAASINLELSGNAYMLMDRQGGKDIKAIYILNSRTCKPVPVKEPKGITELKDVIQGYAYGADLDKVKYKIEEIIHERKYNPSNDIEGLSPIKAGAIAIDTSNEARHQNYNIFKNGFQTNTVLSTDQTLATTVYQRLMADLEMRNKGTINAHKPMILEQGLTAANVGISLKDLEFILGLKMTREEICGYLFKVPLILLGFLENSSYNNISEAQKMFFNYCIIPRLEKNKELFQKLIEEYNQPGAFIDYDLSKVEALKENITEKITNYIALVRDGRITPNQAAKLVGLSLEDIPGGDIAYVPFNLSPVGSIPEPEAEPTAPAPAPGKTIKKLSQEQKDFKWKTFIRITEPLEALYKKYMNKFFVKQEADVLAELRKYKAFSYEKVQDVFVIYGLKDIVKIPPGDLLEVKEAINIDSVLFDANGQAVNYAKGSKQLHAEAMKQTAEAEIELFNLGIAFDLNNPRAAAFLAKYSLDKAKMVMGTLKDRLREQLIEGINNGESIEHISARLAGIYDGYITPQGSNVTTIARTEIIGASNEGALESYRQSGINLKKGWLAAQDERTRDAHIEADNKYSEDGIELDENFQVGGEGLQAPGQGQLPENNINCRCSIIPILPKD